ncbi:MAG: TadA family conjugal transfer-associated ATPase, partial [Humibacter sp.]
MPVSSTTRPTPVPFVPAPEDGEAAQPEGAAVPVGVKGEAHAIPAAGHGGSSTDKSGSWGGGQDWTAFGPLAPFVAGDGVTDVFVNGRAGLWVDAGGGAVRVPSWTCDEPSLRALAVRLVALGGRHVDEANPCVDVRLAGGIRIHVVLPPVSTSGTLVSI